FEFSDSAGASHLAAHQPVRPVPAPANEVEPTRASGLWTDEAERELKKIPFFVRGKAKRNTETFAAEQGRGAIDLATLYDAKAHYAR
ncbi:MAG: ferredoxin:protochlorophyllide reductase (ATP-dependent) subunit B, partial [Sphingomonadales bacterium]